MADCRLKVFCALLLIFAGCTGKIRNDTDQGNLISFSSRDSIEIIDSLVELNKIRDPQLSLTYALKALVIGSKDSSKCLQAKANMIAGSACSNFHPDSAFLYYTEALRLAKASSCREILPDLYYSLAMVHLQVSNTGMAIMLMDSANKVSMYINDFKTKSNIFNLMGSFYWELGDSAKALEMFTQSFDLASRHNHYRTMGSAWSNMAGMDSKNPRFVQKLMTSLSFLQKSPGSERQIGMVYNNIGNNLANPDSAIFYLQRAAEFGEKSNDHEIIVLAFNNMAYSYIQKQNLIRAKWCLMDKAIPVALKDSNFAWLAYLYDSYADVLMAGNQGMEAAGYLKKAIFAGNKAVTLQSARQTRLLMALLDLKNKELTIRDHEQEILVRKAREQRMWLILGILIIVLMLSASLAIVTHFRNKMKNQALETEHTRKLMALESSEKNRVAMQLHDLIGPIRNILSHPVEDLNFQDPDIRQNMLSKLQKVSSALRHLSYRMNSAMREQLSFNEVFSALHDDFEGFTEVPVSIEVDPACNNLGSEITGQVFFIVLELLTNGVKYVKTGTILLTISVEYDNLYILYHDDGPGFDPEVTRSNGMGLNNIHDRAAILHGKAHLKSSPGSGTEWTISLPLSKNLLKPA
jgi:signal transduction histidine kinase